MLAALVLLLLVPVAILFAAAVGAATVDAGVGADSIHFNNAALSGASFAGGAGADNFSANLLTVGASGISFWGGAGDDTFNFTSITSPADGTAYFWNEAGTDSIVLGGAVSSGSTTGTAVVFGVTAGSSTNISFAAGSIGASATSTFGAGTMSSSWSVAGSNLVSFGFGSTQTTIVFTGGGGATLQGGVFEGASGTNIFTNALASTGTGNFGIVGAIPTFS